MKLIEERVDVSESFLLDLLTFKLGVCYKHDAPLQNVVVAQMLVQDICLNLILTD